eukprot:TRINITY_DN1508_c0_g1_i1.p2 TRINITY_DN1508_c0_g1~~TRINITY_DN1508_c0_g1_i1.p2  ORF type:complete len:601 (+),score=122.16 TRINITY_DN1508_c0_g1_i1:2909-4711(+)
MGRSKDPRILTSKDYQKKVFSDLSLILVGLDYPHPIDQDLLNRPNSKDYLNVTEFLVRQLDPTFILPRTKSEEYLPRLAKYIGYPYPFQKNWLIPVGAPNTWPHLIGFLQFLVDLVNLAKAYQVFLACASSQNQKQEMSIKEDADKAKLEDFEKVVDAAVEKGLSVEEFTGKPVDFHGLQETTFQLMYSLTKSGKADKAAEMEATLNRLQFFFLSLKCGRLTKLVDMRKKRNETLYKQNEELQGILAEQERNRPHLEELLNTCGYKETELKKLKEENKVLKGKEEKLKTEQEAKNSRIQEYKLRQEEVKVEYEKVKELVEKQTYSKAGIAKIVTEIGTIEENIKKLQATIREEEKKILERKQEKRELEDAITKTTKKLNVGLGKVYEEGNSQIKFDPERPDQMLATSNGVSLEAFEENQAAVFRNKKEELAKQETLLAQLKEEIKQKSKENEESQKGNDSIKEDVAGKRRRLEEIVQAENEAEAMYKKELEKCEESFKKIAKEVEELSNESAALEDESQKRKGFLDALVEQRKKDKEETKKMVTEFVNEILEYKIEMADDFDQLATVIHNVNVQLQQAENCDNDNKELVAQQFNLTLVYV